MHAYLNHSVNWFQIQTKYRFQMKLKYHPRTNSTSIHSNYSEEKAGFTIILQELNHLSWRGKKLWTYSICHFHFCVFFVWFTNYAKLFLQVPVPLNSMILAVLRKFHHSLNRISSPNFISKSSFNENV